MSVYVCVIPLDLRDYEFLLAIARQTFTEYRTGYEKPELQRYYAKSIDVKIWQT